ncbi:MAG: hypothetical protein KKA73_09270 [Chloroflexi bacterium]|nr:hypothetical protein [Chloroflexota bacterium]MBU1747868.1 hypothetical protein [Chloroflexota bacterium]
MNARIDRYIPGAAILAILIAVITGLMVTSQSRFEPRFALAQGGGCGGIPCTLACPEGQVCACTLIGGGVYTWICGWPSEPPPPPTAVPRPTDVPPTPGGPTAIPQPTRPPVTPSPTPCLDRYQVHLCEVATGCSPAYGRDVTYIYDCLTDLLIGRYQGDCHVCWGTPTPSRTPGPTSIAPTPVCQPLIGAGGRVQVDPDCIAQVQAVIPCVEVYRTPYPRSLVGHETAFIADPASHNVAEFWSNQLPEGVPDDRTTCMGVQTWRYRHYQLGLKWVRIDSPQWDYGVGVPGPYPPQPNWNFDERSWNLVAPIASGEQVQHTYQTSSWGKPQNGPDGLPSYQVRYTTYWALFWAVQFDEWECVDGEDRCVPRNPDGTCRRQATSYLNYCGDVCPGQSGNAYWVCTECDWVPKFNGWHLIDLREDGAPNWYETSVKVAIPQQNRGCSSVIPVPVIEVQGVIEQ